jgi:putative membrane-bound dehydrogenase-like protein
MICRALLPLLTLPAAAQDLTERFSVPEGLRVSLWAESPQLYNPTAMDVGPRGRVWVTEAVNYRRWGGRNPGRTHEGGDRVVILDDLDGDGRCDSSKVFVQDPDLTAPLGICVVGQRVYVSCSPHIFVYTDTDGDDQADEREIFLTGFGGFDHDHGVHSVVAGDDGWLYIAAGNAGPHIVTGSDGTQVRSGSIYAGGSPYNGQNQANLVSDDGRVWVGGIMLRVRPDGTDLEVLADNFRNQYEIARDAFGNLYTEDNDDDGNRGCRTVWVAEGGDYGYFSQDGSRSWRADRRPGQETQVAHWHADDPGVMPPGTINGAGGPTGVAVYEIESGRGPMAPFYGAVLNCDAGAGVVYAHVPEITGGGMTLRKSTLIGHGPESGREVGDGRKRWFRPSDVLVLPDGSVLVADWFDPGVGGHGAGDREAYGRLLRVSTRHDGPTWEKPVLRRATPQEVVDKQWPGEHTYLIGMLESQGPSVRAAAREKLLARGDLALEELKYMFELSQLVGDYGDQGSRARARILQVLAQLSPAGREFVETHGLNYSYAPMRAVAARALDAEDPARLARNLPALARDESPFVRATVARLVRDYDDDLRLSVLVELAKRYPLGDRHYLESLGIGAEGIEGQLFAQLGELDPQAYLDLLWRLHPAEEVAELAAQAAHAAHPLEVRSRLIDALAFVPTREAADAMFVLGATGPEDLRDHAKWWSRHRATNDWRAFDFQPTSEPQGLQGATRLYASGVLKAPKLVDVDVDVAGSSHLFLVVTDGGDGDACDWAAWVAPRFVTADGADVSLKSVGWTAETHGWGSTLFDRDPNGGKLRVGDDVFSEGIGTHATSQIEFAVPANAVRFVAQAGPGYGGTSQGCGTSIEFQVWVKGQAADGDVLARQAAVRGGDLDLALEMAREPEGGLFLISLSEEGALDAEAKEAIGGRIFQNPDHGVRALASAHFPRPGGGGTLPPVRELLALEGDPGRGHGVFHSERATCSSCHAFEGQGKDIGPDLTAIRTKYDRAQLLDSILNPSAAIAFGYDTYVVRTEDGLIYSGFLLAEAQDLVLKDTQGLRHVIPTDQIDVRKKQTLSVMPEGVALGLEGQDVADLLAFLSAPEQREPKFGEPISLFNGVDMSGWTYFLNGDQEMSDVWTVADGIIRCEGRPAGYIRTEESYTNYELTLEWRFLPERGAGNSGVLLRMVGKDKVWPKSIESQLMSKNAGDIWNIDQFPMVVDADRTSGRRTRKRVPTNEVPFGEWNRYRIRLDKGELTIEVNGVVQNTGRWCEEVPGKICLQSEGAYIEFRNIALRPIVN